MSTFIKDIRYGLRQVAKNPGFTLVMVLVLSLGVSVSVALFVYVDWRLHPPSPFADPQHIVHISASSETEAQEEWSYLDFLALREQLSSLAQLATVRYGRTILKKDQWSREYETAEVSRNFFAVAGVHAILGTAFSEADGEELRSQPGVVLSHRLWKSQFGSDPKIIGRPILLDGVSRIIRGIAPRWFHSVASRFEHGPAIDFWIPVEVEGGREDDTCERLVGRLKPGASLSALRGATESAFRRLGLRNPDTLIPLKAVVLSDREYRNAAGYPAPAILLIGIGCVVLLIACLNVSGLLLAQADARRTEMAVRRALGGGRIQLTCQLLAEGTLFAGLALGVGLLASYWLMSLLVFASSDAALGPAHYLNPRVALFSLSIMLASTLLFEFLPIWYACKTNPIAALKADRSDLARGARRRYGFSALVILQLALTLVLMYCAGLLFRSYLKADALISSFQKKDVLLARLQLHGNQGQNQAFLRDLVAHVRTLSGVQNVGLGLWGPTDDQRGRREYQVSVPGGSPVRNGPRRAIQANIVTPGYFPTTGMAILRGRNFAEPSGPSDAGEVIINEAFASHFWPGQDPVGRFVQLVDPDSDHAARETAQVVGLVRDVRKRALSEAPDPHLYVPLGQAFSDEMTLLVETRGDPHLLADPIRNIIARLDSSTPVYLMTTLYEETQKLISGRATDAKVLGTLSLLGMVLAGIGLYGIVAFAVTRRTHELGVRMALGARSRDVLRVVIGPGLKLSLIGVGMGLIGSFVLSRALRASLLAVGPFDSLAFAGASLVLLGAALLACYLPARRAARIDPMVALRYE